MRRTAAILALGLLGALYVADLTGTGMVSADEPRYAEIGREMAAGGDWITPHLWRLPWFEKPPLLYWMTAAAFSAGLGPDVAPRLPVALLSLGFLAFFWVRLKREWNVEVAWHAAAVLATSAGWLAYSHVAVTDLPMSAFFSASVLLATSARPRWIAAAACLAVATLAKGLVPLVLFIPVLCLGFSPLKSRPLKALAALLVFLAIALPWYLLCAFRNGAEFARVFFLQQTFGRFNSDALQHAQPFWFYAQIALLLLYPWFPLLAFAPRAVRDSRSRTLAAVVIFGFVFFSVMKNKLPGYLLPLLPSACVLIAVGYTTAVRTKWATAAVIALLGLLPLAAKVVPEAISSGLRRAQFPAATLWWLAAALTAALLSTFLVRDSSRFAVTGTLTAAALLWFQFAAFPAIDLVASARPVWRARRPDCAPPLPRSLVYGLQYYAGRTLPPCAANSIDRSRSALYGTERR